MRESRRTERMHLPKEPYEAWIEGRVAERLETEAKTSRTKVDSAAQIHGSN